MGDCRNLRPIKILNLLMMNSDEDHPMSTDEILEALHKEGISCERKALKMNIDLLNDNGFEIMCNRGRKS